MNKFKMDLQLFNGVTKLEHLVDPEVMAASVSAKLPKMIRFAPLARIDNTLVGRPGSTLTVPKFRYIGAGIDVAEGGKIDITQLETTTEEFTIKKAAKGISLTDEAVLSGYGDPMGEAENQLALALADKMDNDALEAMATTKLVLDSATGWDADTVSDAIDLFGDEDSYGMVLVMNPKDATKLRKSVGGDWERASDLGDDIIVNGTYGAVLGAQIVRSKKLLEGEAYIVKVGQQSTNEFDDSNSGALAMFYKRDVDVEADRDITRKTTVMTSDAHYGVYLYDESKCVKLDVGFTITFKVVDGATDIENAVVEVAGRTLITDNDGESKLNLQAGTYEYKVTEPEETTKTGTVTVTENATVTVDFQ